MKYINYILLFILLILSAVVLIVVSKRLSASEPTLLQGMVECQQYKAASKIAGRIDTIYISEGNYVKKGELLYRLTTPELSAKLAQVEAVKSAAEALDKQTLAGARVEQISAAKSIWQKAKAGRVLSEQSFDRATKLYQNGVIPKQKLDEATANFAAMKATEDAAYAEYTLALAGATQEQKAAAAAQVKQAQGAISEVETYISDSKVFAAVSGEVSAIAHQQGEIVGSGATVVTILDLSDIWVLFNIKETLLPQIKLGMSFRAYIPALDRYVMLKVGNIAAQADFATWNATRTKGSFDIKTFAVKMYPEKSYKDLRPGMSAIIDMSDV